MITPIQTPWEPELWHKCLRDAIRSSHALLEYVDLPPRTQPSISNFPVLVPRGFAARIQSGEPNDPILKQVIEDPAELTDMPGFSTDPLQESQGVSPAPGLIQKYAHRALLITTSGCAVNCRYCFRRHFPYAEHRQQQHTAALAHLASDHDIEEIILSGGDPLLLDDAALTDLIERLGQIPHLTRLRIHTRIPIVLPERVTAALLSALAGTRLQVAIVVHCNHAQELDASTARAFAALKSSGAWILNQSVLLKGVNDDLERQCELAKRLFSQGVLPYYLHLPDRVAGTHHFFVEQEQAKQLYSAMQGRLPGYLVPKLAQEIPGAAAKVLIQS